MTTYCYDCKYKPGTMAIVIKRMGQSITVRCCEICSELRDLSLKKYEIEEHQRLQQNYKTKVKELKKLRKEFKL